MNALHELFSEKISDETAYQLVNFLYGLALTIESFYLAEIMRHGKSIVDSSNRPEPLFDPEPLF